MLHCDKLARMRVAILSLLPLLALAGCGYGNARTAHAAQSAMVGMSSADLFACAGPPDKVTRLSPAAEIDSYDYKPTTSTGLGVTLPLSLGGLTLGSSGGACSAIMRVVNGHVTEVHYAGSTDEAVGQDGTCAPVVRGCMRQPEPTMKPLEQVYDQASAYHSPAVPPQPPAAEIVTQPALTTSP
jgi:hypothetical protein